MVFYYNGKPAKFFVQLIVCTVITYTVNAQTFTKIVGAAGLATTGSKEGGAVWADFDNDGDLDVVVNTNNSTIRSRLYQNDGGSPPTFTDITATYAAGFLNNTTERSAIWGDLNNDGYIDYIRNAYDRVEIYINRGVIGGYTDYSLGVDSPIGGSDEQLPNLVFTSLQDGQNAEGIGLMDYDNDGWLDIIVENHNYGIDILKNNLNGKTVMITGASRGMASCARGEMKTPGWK